MSRLLFFSLSIFLIFWTRTSAQVLIEINDTGYFINGQKITRPMSESTLTGILGTPDRNFDGINTICTYDKLGIRLYKSRGANTINSLYLDCGIGHYKFSPAAKFGGGLKINDFIIGSQFNKDSLSNIPDLFFDMDRPIAYGYSAVTFNDVTILFSFDKENNLQNVGISFSEIDGDFRVKSSATNSQSTLDVIGFKYENGLTKDGKKTGVWEYYDRPDELSLRYNHDTKEILYLNKNEDEFVIKDGMIWVRSQLDSYPRIIGSDVEFRRSLSKLIGYPIQARSQGISGTVYVSFIIDKNSNLRDIKIEKDIEENCGTEVVKALNSLNYSWTGAVKGNEKYDSKFILPVTFVLGEKKRSILPTGEKLYLPEAYKIQEIEISALGVPSPIRK